MSFCFRRFSREPDMAELPQPLSERLAERERQGLLRRLNGARGRLCLTSNDYLGFASDRELQDRYARELARVEASGTPSLTGSTGSRLLSGNDLLHEEAERTLAELVGAPAAL